VSGAHVVAWVTAAVDDFVFTKTKPVEFNSSKHVVRSFCAQCGTPLTYRREQRAGAIDITLATLDRPSDISPIDHVYMKDAVTWDRPKDGLPQYAETRESPRFD
jgi:hypothetical protein